MTLGPQTRTGNAKNELQLAFPSEVKNLTFLNCYLGKQGSYALLYDHEPCQEDQDSQLLKRRTKTCYITQETLSPYVSLREHRM